MHTISESTLWIGYTIPTFKLSGKTPCRKDSLIIRDSHISLPTGTNGKPLAAIGKFPNTIGKLMLGKTLTTNGEEITNARIGNNVLAIYW